MALTKTRFVMSAAVTLTAGGPPSQSLEVECATHEVVTVGVTLTNGATGPTTRASAQVEYQNDSATNWIIVDAPIVGSNENSEAVTGNRNVPASAVKARITYTHPTGQNVTADAEAGLAIS